jgi:two-component system, OmpR family, response regulator
MAILVVDDDATMCGLLVDAFEQADHVVVSAANGEQALQCVAAAPPDLLVLDLGLPDFDGFEVCRRIRRDSRVPILMLTGRGREEDVLRGFRLGVDDYVTKPVSMRLLVARAAALLRRAAERDRRERETRLRAGPLELDSEFHEVRNDGEPIHLSPLEFRVLHLLMANKGAVVSYGRLIEYAWNHDGGNPAHLKLVVYRLRKKLDLPVGGAAGIQAITGTGYSLRSF